MLQFSTLGDSGLRIPRIGIGCRSLGSQLTESESINLIRAALDLGLTFFDTADVYGGGKSERLLGRALAGDRDRCVIATKFRHCRSHPGAGRKSIRVALEGSLRRLGVEYIDLLQLHGPDPAAPMEETIMTLQDLTQEGKIFILGCVMSRLGKLSTHSGSRGTQEGLRSSAFRSALTRSNTKSLAN